MNHRIILFFLVQLCAAALIAVFCPPSSGSGFQEDPSQQKEATIASIKYLPPGELTNGAFLSLVYSADSKTLIAAAADRSVHIYDFETAHEQVAFAIEESTPKSRGYAEIWARSPDDQMLIMSGSSANYLQSFAARSGKVRVNFERLDQEIPRVNCVACSVDGRLIAVGTVQGEVVVWDAATGHRQFKTSAHIFQPRTEPFPTTIAPFSAQILALAFNPDASLLLAASLGTPLRCWDVRSGAEVEPPVHIAESWDLAQSPDGKLIVTTDRADDGVLGHRKYLLYDMTTWKKQSEWTSVRAARLALLGPGRLLAFMEDRHTVQLRDVTDGAVLAKLDVALSTLR